MSPTAANKGSLDFLSDLDTKSPVAFTSPLALYREAKKRYPSLTLRQVKTWLQSKDTYTLHKPVRYNFPRNRVIVTGILMISGKQIWWTSVLWHVLTRPGIQIFIDLH